MNNLNSWRNEDDETNWIPYNYKPGSKRSAKESVAQFSNRMKFSLANSILHPIKDFLKVSFIKYNKGRRSGYNTAIGLFLTNAVRGEHPNFEVNFSAIEVSKGTLPGLHKWEFHVNDQEISLTWINETKKTNAYSDDDVHLFLFNISKKSFILAIKSVKRANEKINYVISPSKKENYVAWAFVTNRDDTNSSNSHFLGRFKMGM